MNKTIKRVAFFLLLLFATYFYLAPFSYGSAIEGLWLRKDRYSYSELLIVEEEGSLNAKVIYSKDGTSEYLFSEELPRYVFVNLKKVENELFVDGTSSATQLQQNHKVNRIVKIQEDSLAVYTYVLNKEIKEIWTRKN